MDNTKNIRFVLSMLIFLVGFLSCFLVLYLASFAGLEKPLKLAGLSNQDYNLGAPGDWIKLADIRMTETSIIINVENASLSQYAPTGSMKPVFDAGANGIRIVPNAPEDINIGDIVTFGESNIVHRVVEKGIDEEGYWFITKGDNNALDDGMIRFSDINYVTIGVLY